MKIENIRKVTSLIEERTWKEKRLKEIEDVVKECLKLYNQTCVMGDFFDENKLKVIIHGTDMGYISKEKIIPFIGVIEEDAKNELAKIDEELRSL